MAAPWQSPVKVSPGTFHLSVLLYADDISAETRRGFQQEEHQAPQEVQKLAASAWT